jgi:uncharacterized membrane protein YbaN (DUF454 family)
MSARKRKPVKRHEETAAEARGRDEGEASVSERDGAVVMREPRLFRPGREAFCRRLADAAAGQKDVRSVHVCLASGTCRLEFEAGRATASEMAGRFAAAVHQAIPEGPGGSGPARRPGWVALTVFPSGDSASVWETAREARGELRLRNPILRKDLGLARRVARDLSGAPGVASCRATLWGRDLEVRFDPDVTSTGPVVAAAEAAFRKILRPALDQSTAEYPAPPAVATGLRRAWYLALAGGSFGLTVVGLAVPGVPTVPFLMSTSYYLVRSSPRLNARLLRSRFFGPILTDLEKWGGLRRINKVRLIALTLLVSLVTVVLVGPPLVLLLIMAAVASGSAYGITRLPGIPSQAARAPSPTVA